MQKIVILLYPLLSLYLLGCQSTSARHITAVNLPSQDISQNYEDVTVDNNVDPAKKFTSFQVGVLDGYLYNKDIHKQAKF